MWNHLLNLLGFRYIANLNPKSKEIHYLPESKASCGLKYLKNGKRLTRKGMLRHINEKGYNGCVHCLTNKDNG